jgi:hypothetical protein
MGKSDNDVAGYSEAEIEKRRDEVIRRMANTLISLVVKKRKRKLARVARLVRVSPERAH